MRNLSLSKDTVILLCNLTDAMAEPWIDAGYRIIMVDPQHEQDSDNGQVLRLARTVVDAAPVIGEVIRQNRVAFVAGFPPCTDVAVSGARWWELKRTKDPYFQAKAAIVAEQCRMTCLLSGAPGFFENPVSAFSKIFGTHTHTHFIRGGSPSYARKITTPRRHVSGRGTALSCRNSVRTYRWAIPTIAYGQHLLVRNAEILDRPLQKALPEGCF